MKNFLSMTLSALGVKYTSSYTSGLYKDNPDRNNMFGLVSLLNTYGVVAHGYHLESNDTMKQLATPFVAHRKGRFNLVYECDGTMVTFREEGSRKKMKLPYSVFVNDCSGAILTLEANSQSIEPDYQSHLHHDNQRTVKKISWFVSIIVLLSMACCENGILSSVSKIIYLLLNMTGLVFCYQLLKKQTGKRSQLGESICSLFSINGCDDVLESNAAKALLGISWSEMGFAYFMTNVVSISSHSAIAPHVAFINILLLPLTIVSIAYQKFKLHRWCGLCLSVITVLWLMAAVGWLSGLLVFRFHPAYTIMLCCGYLFLSISTHYLINRTYNEKFISQDCSRLINNPAVFKALLIQQEKYDVSPQDSFIYFGDPASKVIITIFSNPHCGPCSRLHHQIREVLEQQPNIGVQYVLTSFNQELAMSNRFLIAAYLDLGKESITVFNEWYASGRKRRKEFMADYHFNMDNPVIDQEMEQHANCFKVNHVNATPLILINGHILPSLYSSEDLNKILTFAQQDSVVDAMRMESL